MKKLGSIFLLITMLACSKEKIEITSAENKQELINKVLVDNNTSIKELEKIKNTLKKQIEDGVPNAKKELEEWENIEQIEELKQLKGTIFDEAKDFKF